VDVEFLTDKIRELCARIVVAQGAEFELVVDELRTFIREHREQILNLLEHSSLEVPAGFDGHSSGSDLRRHLC
jgi:hypothetical protein